MAVFIKSGFGEEVGGVCGRGIWIGQPQNTVVIYLSIENIIIVYEPDIWNIGTCMNQISGILERV